MDVKGRVEEAWVRSNLKILEGGRAALGWRWGNGEGETDEGDSVRGGSGGGLVPARGYQRSPRGPS